MAQEITRWKTKDGQEFDDEIEALRHENKVLSRQTEALEDWKKRNDNSPISSYGSSGGGGHD